MFIILKKKVLWIVVAVVVAAVIIGVAVGVSVKVASAANASAGVIVIDAGHGGIDGGVEGRTSGVKESDINLAIAENLRGFLEANGYKVVMTRSTTDGLYGLSRKNRKVKDMEARRKIIEKASPDMVISIHQNAFASPSVKGPHVFYAPSSESGREAANLMQKVLNTNLSSDKNAKPGDYFVLQCSRYLSLLVECGFLSNPDEERLLVSASYQEKVAYTIYTAIHSILSPVNGGSGNNKV